MKRFSVVSNGYDINEVNRFIDIVINRLEKLNDENTAYVKEIEELKQNKQTNNSIDTSKLEKALLAIEETSDRIKEASKEEARVIVEEAKNNANSIIHEALIDAQKKEQEFEVLKKNYNVYRTKMESLVKAQLELLKEK